MRTILWIVAVVFGIILCASAIGWYTSAARATRATLADGTRIEVIGTSIGTNLFTNESSLTRFLNSILPARVTLSPNISSKAVCARTSDSVTVYLRVVSPPTASSAGTWWLNADTSDAAGIRYAQSIGNCRFNLGGGEMIYGFPLQSFPRRQAHFLMNLLNCRGELIASIEVRNPVLEKSR